MLFTDHYFLLVSLLPSMVGDEIIHEHLDEDKEKSKMEMVLVDREKNPNLSLKKFLAALGLLSLTDSIQLKI